MRIKVYTLNAFSKLNNGGNPAGVVLNSDSLSEKEMCVIAKKIGFSETAFVQKSKNADFKIRFFTPNKEVDLCGHATIATFYLLANQDLIKPGNYNQETRAGILNVEVRNDKIIFMSQNPPEFFEIINKGEIAKSLNISEDKIVSELPAQIVSTGLRDILIPINNLKDLNSIKPNFNKIAELSKTHNVIGYHLFTLKTKFGSTAHCRNFAPLCDVYEEAATGTSNGALGCFLFKYGKIKAKNMIFEQGYSMNKPSEILVSLKTDNQQIVEVKVGGIATNIKEYEIEI